MYVTLRYCVKTTKPIVGDSHFDILCVFAVYTVSGENAATPPPK